MRRLRKSRARPAPLSIDARCPIPVKQLELWPSYEAGTFVHQFKVVSVGVPSEHAKDAAEQPSFCSW